MYWNKDLETLDRGRLESLQLQRLNATLEKASRAPFYKTLLSRDGFRGISSLSELSRLPFTSKADLRQAFPYGFLAVPLESVVRLHSSSGTTGNPTVIYHTKEDIDDWQDLVARCMYMAGVRKTDVFQNMMGYGLFTGGIGFHYGAEKLGAMTIPIGPGNSKRQIWFMREFGTTVIHVLPSYALRLATHVQEMGLDPRRDLKLRIAFVGAEPHTEETRRRIEETWGIKAYNSYGLSEMCGPGVAFECPEQSGMHIWEDHFCVEVVDPETGKPVPEGECGELVLTSITRTGTPLLRYRTRDLTRIIPGRCPCGRTHRRIDRILGRSDDMMIINGVNIFPQQIEQTLMRIPGIGANYLIEIHEENFMDKLHVSVEMSADAFQGTLSGVEGLHGRVLAALKEETGVTPVVKLLEGGSLPAAEGKAVRVVDLRPHGKREC
ncbi:MAG TPA: phenylacetate--CoA ligase [Spirochaetia bacterium]|nr:phenylacetate--CoA ligase [Spirochaetia bacterium]